MTLDDGRPPSEKSRGSDDSAAAPGGRDVYRGWYVVLGGFVGALVVFGLSYAFGVFLGPIRRELELSQSTVSFVFSLQTLVVYVAAAILGVVADRYGVRRLLALGAGALAVGGIWAAFARTYAGLLVAYGVVTAIGLGSIYVVSYATVPRWFERRRGLATGIATAGLGVGMVATAPAANALVGAVGWRWALFTLVSVAAVAVAAVVPLFADDPASSGVDATAEFPSGVPDREPPDWTTYRREVAAVASSRAFLLVFLGWVLIYAAMYAVFVHLVQHAGDVGIGEGAGALALAAIGATTAVSRVGVGALSDRIGRVTTFVACSVTMGLATAVLPAVGSATGLYAFALVFGIAYGGNGALLSPLTVELFGAANANAVFGLVSLSFAVSGLIAPWAAGLTFDLVGTYDPAFVGAGVAALFGTILVAIAGFEGA